MMLCHDAVQIQHQCAVPYTVRQQNYMAELIIVHNMYILHWPLGMSTSRSAGSRALLILIIARSRMNYVAN